MYRSQQRIQALNSHDGQQTEYVFLLMSSVQIIQVVVVVVADIVILVIGDWCFGVLVFWCLVLVFGAWCLTFILDS
tara:strand:- start:110 stop:337 length:228 start_codon:yes stop_codon:yes gene_type:complete